MGGTGDRKHWVVLGRVARAHGIHGTLRIRWYSDPSVLSAPLTQVQLAAANAPAKIFTVLSLRMTGPEGALIDLDGLESIDDAAEYRGCELRVPRALIPPALPGETYLFELLGLNVYTTDGRLLGRANNLYDYGAGPLLGMMPVAAAEDPQPDASVQASTPSDVLAADTPRARRGKRRRRASQARQEELLLALLPKVLREVDVADNRAVVDAVAAGFELP